MLFLVLLMTTLAVVTNLNFSQTGRTLASSVVAYKIGVQDLSDNTYNGTVPLCQNSHTCPGGCQSNTTGCSCDDLCHLFNDCCQDLPCDVRASTAPGLEELGIDWLQIGCVIPSLPNDSLSMSLTSPDTPTSGFFMIDKCPDVESELATKCHKPNISDIQSTIPVSEDTYGVSFRNVYCALCNNIDVDDLIWWKLLAQCEEDILTQLQQNLKDEISLAETLKIINDFCPISFGPPGKFVSQIGTRQCYSRVIETESCLANTSNDVLNRCSGYTAYVVDNRGAVFRNADCYICSKVIDKQKYEVKLACNFGDIPKIYENLIEEPSVPIGPVGPELPGLPGPVGPGDPFGPGPGQPDFIGPIEPIGPPGRPGPDPDPDPVSPGRPELRPISVIVDFSSNSGVTVQVADTIVKVNTVTCEDDEVYDPFAGKCRTLSCSEGYTLIGDQCVPIPTVDNECSGEFIITITVSKDVCKEARDINVVQHCLEDLFHQPDVTIKNESYVCVDNGYSVYKFNLESSTSFFDFEKKYDTVFLRSGTNQLQNTCNIDNFTLSLYCDPADSVCDNRVTLQNVSIESRNNSEVVINKNTEYLLSGGILSLHYDLINSDTKPRKLIIAELCDVNQLACTLVTLNASLFTNYSTGELVYEPTGELYSRDEYIYTPDGQIQVCSFLERNGTRNETQTITFLAYDTSQIILSLVGCIISMMALLVTFITYVVFSKLRTRATKAIMNLVVALFTAQLVFLLGAGSTDNAHTCTFIAVFSHYLWLCTFTWSTVLSFDLNKTFSSKLQPRYQERQANIYPYLLYGWLTPSIVIVPCLVLHFCACSDIPINYGNEGACWIYNQYTNLVVFGGPLLVCLFVNCIFFFNTLWNIHASKQRTKILKPDKSRLQNIKEELLIYVKIATLMGFTWMFAFSAAFSGVSALWYLYIIINSLQGLYIFFAFIFNRRIGRLWKEKLRCSQSESIFTEESSNSKVTKSSATNSTPRHEATYQTESTALSGRSEEEDTSV